MSNQHSCKIPNEPEKHSNPLDVNHLISYLMNISDNLSCSTY